jgi:hypothetical protein
MALVALCMAVVTLATGVFLAGIIVALAPARPGAGSGQTEVAARAQGCSDRACQRRNSARSAGCPARRGTTAASRCLRCRLG